MSMATENENYPSCAIKMEHLLDGGPLVSKEVALKPNSYLYYIYICNYARPPPMDPGFSTMMGRGYHIHIYIYICICINMCVCVSLYP